MNETAPAAAGTLQGGAGRVLELLQAGGPVVVVLLLLSVAALAIVFVKLWQFRAVRLADAGPARQAIRLWEAGRTAEAVQLASASRNPVAQVLSRAMRGQRQGLPEARLREEVVRRAAAGA